METIRTIRLSSVTRQEDLPDFAPDFPYRLSRSEPASFPGGQVPLRQNTGQTGTPR